MELQQIRYFNAVARTLNFTRAAEQCNVSQPSLTRAIQMLELELGGPLFHRERGNTHLTELGRMMEPYLSAVVDQTTAAKLRAQSYGKLEMTPLKIGAMCTVGPAIVSDLILKFRMDHPGVEFVVSDCTARSLTDMLIAGDLSLALFGSPEPLDDRFHALELFEESFVIAMSRNHRLASRTRVRGCDLHGEAYVNRSHCEYLEHARAELRGRGIVTRQVFSSERDDWVQGMIKAEMGFGFFPEFSLTDPALITRPLVDPGVPAPDRAGDGARAPALSGGRRLRRRGPELHVASSPRSRRPPGLGEPGPRPPASAAAGRRLGRRPKSRAEDHRGDGARRRRRRHRRPSPSWSNTAPSRALPTNPPEK